MESINEAVKMADEIADKLQNSSIYKEYQLALSKIEKDKNLMEKIKQFKIKHLEYANDRNNGNEDFNKEKYISQELYKIMLNEDVRMYFKNEEKLVKLITDVYSRVTEKCYLNIFV